MKEDTWWNMQMRGYYQSDRYLSPANIHQHRPEFIDNHRYPRTHDIPGYQAWMERKHLNDFEIIYLW